MTCEDSSNVTSFVGYSAGPRRYDSLPGQMSLFGPAPVPANPSRTRGRGRGKRTRDTSGRSFDASSPSAVLQESLANRLRASLDVSGSPEYALTWKDWDMQSGPPICALRAAARRTSGSDCSGWPTARKTDGEKGIRTSEGAIAEFERKGNGADLPTVASVAGWPTPASHEPGGTPEQHLERKRQCVARGIQIGCAVTHLSLMAQVAGWPSPNVPNGGRQAAPDSMTSTGRKPDGRKGQVDLGFVAQVAGWASPATRDYRYPNRESYQDRSNSTKGEQLANQVVHQGNLEGWPTPNAMAGGSTSRSKNRKDELLISGLIQPPVGWDTPTVAEADKLTPNSRDGIRSQLLGRNPSSGPAPTASRGVLAPEFSRWLMGYRAPWDVAAPGSSEWRSVQQELTGLAA